MVNHVRNNRLLAQAVSNRRKQNYLETVLWAVTAKNLPDMVIPANTTTINGCINGVKVAYNRYGCEVTFGGDIQVWDGAFIFTGDGSQKITTISWPGSSLDQYTLLANYLNRNEVAADSMETSLYKGATVYNSVGLYLTSFRYFETQLQRVYMRVVSDNSDLNTPIVHGQTWSQDSYNDISAYDNGEQIATYPYIDDDTITFNIAAGNSFPAMNNYSTSPMLGKISYVVFDDKKYTEAQIHDANELMGDKIALPDETVFEIWCGAGLFDFGWNGPNKRWIFPDGTESTADRPTATLTSAGVVRLVVNSVDDWSGVYRLQDNSTNANYRGRLSDLPPITYYLSLEGCTNVTGDLSDLPQVTDYLSLSNISGITGNLSYLPNASDIHIQGCVLLVGAVPVGSRYTTIDMTNCIFADVDTSLNNLLTSVQTSGQTNGTFTATGTCQDVTAASATARTTLRTTYNWTINVNGE